MLLPVAGLVITGGALADQPGTAPPGEIYTFLKLAKFSGEILLLQICQAGLASNMGTFSSFMRETITFSQAVNMMKSVGLKEDRDDIGDRQAAPVKPLWKA